MPKPAVKTSHAAQDVYQTLTEPTKKMADRKIILTPKREVIVLPSKEVPVPPDIFIDTSWDNMDAFLKSNKQTVLAYHDEFLKCEPPKKQDIEMTAMWVWSWFCANGKPILAGATSDGEKLRKSTIGGRIYTVLPVPAAGHGLKTPQAIACLKIVTEEANPTTRCITEADLKARVIARQAELHTRQDPWRIFQYYRPNLIANHLLKHD